MTTGYQEPSDTGTDGTRIDLGQTVTATATATATRAATGTATTRRTELADFLRTRRARVAPETVGLPSGGRRRTPGLRREEVAQLAGVGVTWYTWLEQGRDINVSEQVLEAVARTLRLDRYERAHLFTLAGAVPPVVAQEHALDTATRRVLDAVLPWPACVQNARFDVLAWNRGYARLVGDLDTVPEMDRNSAWLLFTDPEWRRALVDWRTLARQSVGRLRARWPEHAGEPAWQSLVQRLRAASAEFARMWDSHDVTEAVPDHKPVYNSSVGLMRFDLSTTWLAPAIGARMVVFTPADADTTTKLDALLA